MTNIERTWTHFPGRAYAQDEIASYLPRWLSGRKLALATRLFKRSAVASRNLVARPDEALGLGRSFALKNDVYRTVVRETAAALAARIREETSPAQRASIDLLITASCTGFQIPAMDAALITALDLPRGLRRVNLAQHGCAAGAMGISLAHEWLAARSSRRALVVCIELCSLTFQPEDDSEENLVSAAIFGDGAAAVLLAGANAEDPPRGRSRIRVRDTYREIFHDSEHFMGFDLNEAGLKIKLARDVVPFAQQELSAVFARATAAWGLPGASALRTGAVHPGGRRILEVLEHDVGLAPAVIRTSWEALQHHGNMSSVSVLCALDRLLAGEDELSPGTLGLLSAFGPGFCAELGLLEVTPAA
jgi:alkylresorcinol/alkylpyrone synthase